MFIYNHELITGSGYLIVDIDETASPNYYGYERPDGSYIIVKETITGAVRQSLYYKGHGNYQDAWTARAGLSYNYPSLVTF